MIGLKLMPVLALACAPSDAFSVSKLHSSSRVFSGCTSLSMAQMRGLEKRREGASPTKGGMTLFLKAAEDGSSVGDCPFAHFVRMVLEEKGLPYDVKPCTAETKPDWLVEHYDGKMPALRHRKECYVESGVIGEYLEFFFPEPSLKVTPESTEELLDGFFSAVAEYLKSGQDDDDEVLKNLRNKLALIERHISGGQQFICGDRLSLLDCRLAPQLFHLQTATNAFKQGVPNLEQDYPNLYGYYERVTARPSFLETTYPTETVVWGWSNARN